MGMALQDILERKEILLKLNDMKNEELVNILSKELNVQAMLVNCIGISVAKVKDVDFKKKIQNTLAYLDCDTYEEDVRMGFRIFANELEKIIEQ